MAGGHGPAAVNMDPALAKWYSLNQNRYKYFKWTPRTARYSFIYILAVPFAFAYLGYSTDGKYEFRGKLRGDTLAER